MLAIAQDGMGRIWMGTQDGLNCYDGYSFTVFRHVEGDAQSLGDNSVNALFADGGLLWIGTASGLSCYDAATQSFENFRLEGRNMQVADIAATAGGDLILATDLGIVLFDRASRELEIRTYLTASAYTPSALRAMVFWSGPPTVSTPTPPPTAMPCASCRRWPVTTSPASSPTATDIGSPPTVTASTGSTGAAGHRPL